MGAADQNDIASRVTQDGQVRDATAKLGDTPVSLRITIVGAGIGGLTAAIALRKQGHRVLVLEQSELAEESGAAIHLTPNSNGILRRLGIYVGQLGAYTVSQISEHEASGTCSQTVLANPDIWQHPWQLVDRAPLHFYLKNLATREHGSGQPVEILTSVRVIHIDCLNGTATAEDGSEYRADVLVGADGVCSITRHAIPGFKNGPFNTGQSAVRFVIPRSVMGGDLFISQHLQARGGVAIFNGPDRRMIMFLTNNDEDVNFVCIYPNEEMPVGDGWSNNIDFETLRRVYQGLHPSIRSLLSKATASTLNAWAILDMEKLPTFIHGRMALIGDAAHPCSPYDDQAAGMAIEDAASLSAILSDVVSPEEVQDRLELFDAARYNRAHFVQRHSRMPGRNEGESTKSTHSAKRAEIIFGHDAWDYSTQRLREWLWSRRSMYWRQPFAFGPMPGPRQSHFGAVRDGRHSTFVTASILFKTSRTVLENLFPPGSRGWGFQNPGTVAYASLAQTTLDMMEWLGGSGYNHLGLYVHGVQYCKKDGSTVNGTYQPILFENLTDPILSGREELGMPKLFSAIDVHNKESDYYITTSWQGAVWGKFHLQGLKESDSTDASSSVSGQTEDGILAYRYMPKVGRELRGSPAEEYPVFVPLAEEKPAPIIDKRLIATTATIKINALDWGALPTLHHVIERLAEIPVFEVVRGQVVEGHGVTDVGSARRIE